MNNSKLGVFGEVTGRGERFSELADAGRKAFIPSPGSCERLLQTEPHHNCA